MGKWGRGEAPPPSSAQGKLRHRGAGLDFQMTEGLSRALGGLAVRASGATVGSGAR